jgi:putative ABC transport system permease protein
MLRATLKSLLSRKLRLLLSGLAVLLGVMFVAGAFVLTDTLGRSYDSLVADEYGGVEVRVTAAGTQNITVPVSPDLVQRIAAEPGVAKATGIVAEDGARVIGRDGKTVSGFGRDRLGVNWTPERRTVAGHGPGAPGEVALGESLARSAGLKIGDSAGVLTLRPKRTFTVVGLLPDRGDALEVAFDGSVAGELMLGKPNTFTAVDVEAEAGVGQAALRDRLRASLGTGYDVRTGDELRRQQAERSKENLSSINDILLAFAGVSLFVGTFLILNTFSILVAQRTRELALLRALGASRRQAIGSVLVEALAIGLVSSVAGLVLGIGLGWLGAYVYGSIANGAIEVAGVGVPVAAVVASFAVGILVTLVASLVPAVRASRIPPMAALQESATPDRPLTRLTVTGSVIGVVGAAVLVYALGGGLDAPLGLVALGILLCFVGVAFLTPLLAKPVAAALGGLFGRSVPGRLGRLNAARNPRRTANTAAALMVGIAIITGTNTVLNSATVSFRGMAGKQFTADLIIAGDGANGRPPTFDPAVLDRARQLPGVASVAGEYYDEAKIGNHIAGIWPVTDMAELVKMNDFKLVEGRLEPLGNDELVVDAKTAAANGLHTGSTVDITFARGAKRTLTVAGTYSSTWSSGWLLSDSVLPDLTVPQLTNGYIKIKPGADVDEVRRQVARFLADSPEVIVTDSQGFVDLATGIFTTVILMVQVLLALAILIAVLGIVNTMALSVLERTRELGLLRAVGLSRSQTRWMVTAEAVVISTFGALLGVAVGTGIAAAIVRALKSEGVDGIAIPWAFTGAYLLLGVVAGVIAAVLPAFRAARIDVLKAISYE